MKHWIAYTVVVVVALWIGARYGNRIPLIGTGGASA